MSRSSLTEFALANPLYVWVIVLTCLIGGLAGGQRIAQLEDPPYPIKIAYVFTEYPGASTLDVEQEVTEVLERSIQELPWIENIVSRSLPGRSEIEIELNHSVSASDTGQIWDELRRRVAEAAMQLPAGAHPPWVEDDFSDVYGLLYGFTVPDGFKLIFVESGTVTVRLGIPGREAMDVEARVGDLAAGEGYRLYGLRFEKVEDPTAHQEIVAALGSVLPQ